MIYTYIYTQLKFKRRYLLVSLRVVADVEARPSEKSISLSSIACGASDAGVCCASGSGVWGATAAGVWGATAGGVCGAIAGGVCGATAGGVCGATGSEDCCTTTPSGDVLTSGSFGLAVPSGSSRFRVGVAGAAGAGVCGASVSVMGTGTAVLARLRGTSSSVDTVIENMYVFKVYI